MKLLIFDGSNVMMRAFFAVPSLQTSKGFHTNAIKGVVNIVVSLILRHEPTHVAFVMDRPHKTHRHKIFPEYKGNREKRPDVAERLIPQRKPMYDLLTSIGIKVVHKKGVECDDIIGTLTRMFVEAGGEVELVSNDKDFAQLLCKQVRLHKYINETKTYLEITHKNCEELYGAKPNRIVDMMIMQGDGADNIPGVKGIGPAAIKKLLATCKRIEEADISCLNKAQKTAFEEARVRFRLIRRLVTIHTSIIPYSIDKLIPQQPDEKRIRSICKALEASAIRETVFRYVRYFNYKENH